MNRPNSSAKHFGSLTIRIQACALLSMPTEQIAHILDCSLALMSQYLQRRNEFEEARQCMQPT